MSILQRYVLREMLGPFFLGLLVFTFVFLVSQLFRVLELLLSSGVPAMLALELIASLLPGILSITMPMALLVAILLGFGRLAADREVLAIRMSGVNLFHICLPIVAMGGVLAALMIWANMGIVPYLKLKSADLTMQIEFRLLSGIPPDQFYELDSGKKSGGIASIFFYDHRDPSTGDMVGVNIKTRLDGEESPKDRQKRNELKAQYEALKKSDSDYTSKTLALKVAETRLRTTNSGSAEFLITSSRGTIEANLRERLISVELTSGSIHFGSPENPANYNIVRFDSFSKAMRPRFSSADSGLYELSPEEMGVNKLRESMNGPRKLARAARVEFWQRLSIPMACVAFALIAIPLGVYVRPTGKAFAFAISFLLILLYYGLLNYGVSIGRAGSSFAPFAIFFPNLLLSLVGSFLLYRMVMK